MSEARRKRQQERVGTPEASPPSRKKADLGRDCGVVCGGLCRGLVSTTESPLRRLREVPVVEAGEDVRRVLVSTLR